MSGKRLFISKIYILLPVHNRREITRRFVTCLAAQSYLNYHLILIDDGSTDGTAEMVQEQITSLTVIRGTGKWWWGGSLEQGYEWLKKHNSLPGDIVLIINDDTEFDVDYLERGEETLAAHPDALLLSRGYDRRSGALLDSGVYLDWKRLCFNTAKPEEINCLSTRGLFLRMADFIALGGFYPTLLPHYLSDYEFTVRAHRKGMELVCDPVVTLRFENEITGYRSFDHDVMNAIFFKRFFSIKSVSNPFYYTSFILLACPWPWKLVNLCRVWIRAMGKIAIVLRNSFKVFC